MINSRRIRCTGKVAFVGRREIHTGFWWGNLNDTDHLKGLEVDRRIILKRIARKLDRRTPTGLILLR
jgi:hypothetical protein